MACRRRDIIWTIVDILSIRLYGTYFDEHLFEIQENALENAICKMSTILS